MRDYLNLTSIIYCCAVYFNTIVSSVSLDYLFLFGTPSNYSCTILKIQAILEQCIEDTTEYLEQFVSAETVH